MQRRKLKGKRKLSPEPKTFQSYWDWLPRDIKNIIYSFAYSFLPTTTLFQELKDVTWDVRSELNYFPQKYQKYCNYNFYLRNPYGLHKTWNIREWIMVSPYSYVYYHLQRFMNRY